MRKVLVPDPAGIERDGDHFRCLRLISRVGWNNDKGS